MSSPETLLAYFGFQNPWCLMHRRIIVCISWSFSWFIFILYLVCKSVWKPFVEPPVQHFGTYLYSKWTRYCPTSTVYLPQTDRQTD